MATATEQRPAVLKEVTQVGLQEYLRFRHLVSNLYADELRPEPIALLLRQFPQPVKFHAGFSQQAPSAMR